MSYKKFNLYQGFTEGSKTYSFSNAIVTWTRSGSSGNYTYTAYYNNLPNDFPATLQVADLFSGKYVVNSFTINYPFGTNMACSFVAGSSTGRLKFTFKYTSSLKVTVLSSITVGANISYPVKNFKQKYKIYQSVTKVGFKDEDLIGTWNRVGNATIGYTYSKIISIPNCRKIITSTMGLIFDVTKNKTVRGSITVSNDNTSIVATFETISAVPAIDTIRVTVLELKYIPTYSFIPMSTLPGLAYIDLEDYVGVVNVTWDSYGFTYRIDNHSNRPITVEYYLSIEDTDGGEFDDSDTETISPGESSTYHLETDGYAISQAAAEFTITAENAQEYTYEEYQ